MKLIELNNGQFCVQRFSWLEGYQRLNINVVKTSYFAGRNSDGSKKRVVRYKRQALGFHDDDQFVNFYGSKTQCLKAIIIRKRALEHEKKERAQRKHDKGIKNRWYIPKRWQ